MSKKNTYTTKADVCKDFFDIENYEPGSISTQEMGILLSSGTSGNGISMLICKQSPYKEIHDHFYNALHGVLRVSHKANTTMELINSLFRCSSMQRCMALQPRDFENELMLTDILHQFEPEQIMLYPSVLEKMVHLSQSSHSTLFSSTTALYLPGEPISTVVEQIASSIFPNAVIHSEYSLSELINFAYDCAYLKEKYSDKKYSVYHVAADCNGFVDEPDQNGVGEFILSNPPPTRVQNFRTGDLVKIIAESCPCGSKKTLFYIGRKYNDIIKCGKGILFVRKEIERVFDTLRQYVVDYTLELHTKKSDPTYLKIVYAIVLTEKVTKDDHSREFLQQKIERSCFVTQTKTISDMKERGVITESEVQIFDTLGRNKKVPLKKIEEA